MNKDTKEIIQAIKDLGEDLCNTIGDGLEPHPFDGSFSDISEELKKTNIQLKKIVDALEKSK